MGVTVLGASPDTVKDQAKFKEKENLPFTLLADEDHQLAEAYEVWVEKKMFGKTFMGVDRTTFVIDPAGKIAKIFPKVSPKEHSEQVLAALEALQGS
jgi:peroxiredoxin Q/BCP